MTQCWSFSLSCQHDGPAKLADNDCLSAIPLNESAWCDAEFSPYVTPVLYSYDGQLTVTLPRRRVKARAPPGIQPQVHRELQRPRYSRRCPMLFSKVARPAVLLVWYAREEVPEMTDRSCRSMRRSCTTLMQRRKDSTETRWTQLVKSCLKRGCGVCETWLLRLGFVYPTDAF